MGYILPGPESAPALRHRGGLAGILKKGPKKGLMEEGDRKAGAGLDASVLDDEEGLGPETMYQDSRVVEWDVPETGDRCDTPKLSCILLSANVAQGDCLALGSRQSWSRSAHRRGQPACGDSSCRGGPCRTF